MLPPSNLSEECDELAGLRPFIRVLPFHYGVTEINVNSTLALTFMLLSLMFGAVVVSASWGYALGREALKGITQPDIRPTSTLGEPSQAASSSPQDGLLIIPEEKILEDVKARMSGTPGSAPSSQSYNSQTPAIASSQVLNSGSSARAVTLVSDGSSAAPFVTSSPLPRQDRSRGVTLEVFAVRQQGTTLFLDVSLENEGDRPIPLDAEVLQLTDREGQILDADLQGMPSEIRPGSGPVMGSIRLFDRQFREGDRVSLTWTSASDPQIQLQISEIPVSR